jgi:predicted SnoaL-like aldol condensation-catalyzing enzyme
MTQRMTEANKRLVLEALDVLFNKHDYNAALRFWSPNYIQHSAHIPQGREGLFNLIRGAPAGPAIRGWADLGRGRVHDGPRQIFGQWAPRDWIAADIVRIADDVLVEHWDVLQDEATREESQSGRPMFRTEFVP